MKTLIPFFVAMLLIIPALGGAQVQGKNLEAVLLDAAAAGQTDMVRSLLDNGANIEVKNNLGATSLIFAAIKGHSDVAELLVERGANVNAKTTTGITPLIAAAAGGHEDIVKLLLAKGADVSAKDQQGRTALDMAEAAGQTEVSALLKAAVASSGPAPVAAAKPPGPASAPVAKPTSQARTETISAADSPSGLAVRAEPSRKGQVVAYLIVGSTVTLAGEASNGWAKLSAPTKGGWVDQKYLGSRNLEASVVSVDNPEQCLRVRSGPGANQEKIGCLPKGAKLKLTGTVQSGWAQINEPMAGWVTARQIQAPGLFPSTPATAGAQKEHSGASQGAGQRRQQSDSEDSGFERVDRQFDEEISQLRRENEESQAIVPQGAQPGTQFGGQPGGPPSGGLRIGPFGIGLGR